MRFLHNFHPTRNTVYSFGYTRENIVYEEQNLIYSFQKKWRMEKLAVDGKLTSLLSCFGRDFISHSLVNGNVKPLLKHEGV